MHTAAHSAGCCPPCTCLRSWACLRTQLGAARRLALVLASFLPHPDPHPLECSELWLVILLPTKRAVFNPTLGESTADETPHNSLPFFFSANVHYSSCQQHTHTAAVCKLRGPARVGVHTRGWMCARCACSSPAFQRARERAAVALPAPACTACPRAVRPCVALVSSGAAALPCVR